MQAAARRAADGWGLPGREGNRRRQHQRPRIRGPRVKEEEPELHVEVHELLDEHRCRLRSLTHSTDKQLLPR